MGREVLEMRRRDCGMLVTLLIAGLLLAACSRSPSQEVLGAQVPPVTVEAIDGTDLKRVTLIPPSAERPRTPTPPGRPAARGGATQGGPVAPPRGRAARHPARRCRPRGRWGHIANGHAIRGAALRRAGRHMDVHEP